MYGTVTRFVAAEGKRRDLADILAAASKGMRGCENYTVGLDRGDENAIIVSELWKSEKDHLASLESDKVRNAIAKGRPMIAGAERLSTFDAHK